jgi:hypothetical protein
MDADWAVTGVFAVSVNLEGIKTIAVGICLERADFHAEFARDQIGKIAEGRLFPGKDVVSISASCRKRGKDRQRAYERDDDFFQLLCLLRPV